MNKSLLSLVVCLVACNTGFGVSGEPDSGSHDASILDAAVVVNDASPASDSAVEADVNVATDSAVSVCGNGVVTGTEQCDGQDFGVLTCGTFGFVHGALACNAACAVDTSGCSNTTVCGDGIAEGTEECDEDDFRGLWCGDVSGFVAGQLVCTASCTVSTALCLVSVCGDETTTAPYEECDGPDLAGMTCQGLGFDSGVLGCADDCTADTMGCTMDPFCGDGIVDPGEECDEGGNQGGGIVDDMVCEDFGLQSIPDGSGGTDSIIRCWQCQYDTTDCNDCGNGVQEWGEQCDGLNGPLQCAWDPAQSGVCTGDCRSDCSACPVAPLCN